MAAASFLALDPPPLALLLLERQMRAYFGAHRHPCACMSAANRPQLDQVIDLRLPSKRNHSTGSQVELDQCLGKTQAGATPEAPLEGIVVDNTDHTSRPHKSADKGDSGKRKWRQTLAGGARRTRTLFSERQLAELEWRFERNKYLITSDRLRVAKLLNLNQLQVKTWFQNRRMKWKKQMLASGCAQSPTKPKGRPRRDSIPPIDDYDHDVDGLGHYD